MEELTSIKQLIQYIVPNGSEIVQGIVTSSSPLEITLINDAKMVLSVNSLVIPKHLTDYDVNADIMNQGLSKLTIYAGLKMGEAVYLLSYNNRKKYYVLDRMG